VLLVIALCGTPVLSAGQTAEPSVARDDNPSFARELNIPIYEWRCRDMEPRAVLLFIHGTTLHGGVYDTIARSLAAQGYLVYAPDLRGFGRWITEPDKYWPDHRISFFESRADLIRLLGLIHRDYSNIPVLSVGESVGANLSFWLASVAPKLIDGIAVSSPCVTRRKNSEVFCSTLVADVFKAAINPNRKVPIAPYARRYLSEDPKITEAYINDPEIRKTVTVYESLQSLHTNRSCLWFVENIPANMPILVFKGTNDRMFNQDGLSEFIKRVPAKDCQIVSLEGKGHIQLETPFISEQVKSRLTDWLNCHAENAKVSISSAKPPQIPAVDTIAPVTLSEGGVSSSIKRSEAGKEI
jgi:alpha-beta hydrolase superfamily lysophospholipase